MARSDLGPDKCWIWKYGIGPDTFIVAYGDILLFVALRGDKRDNLYRVVVRRRLQHKTYDKESAYTSEKKWPPRSQDC